MEVTELRDAWEGHTLSHGLTGRLWSWWNSSGRLDSEEVHQRGVLNPRTLELRSFGVGRLWEVRGVARDSRGMLREANQRSGEAGLLFYRLRNSLQTVGPDRDLN